MTAEEQKQQKEMISTIAESITAISDSVAALLDGKLKEKTIIILLAHSTKLPKSTVREVLYAIHNMETDYLK
jgi:hypothetical protein